MLRKSRPSPMVVAVVALVASTLTGCTGIREYFHNGLKVGPNYCPPPAPVAHHWIDANDARVREQPADLSHWWTVFNDPLLDRLIHDSYRQNLSLREAGFRILQARAQLCIVTGNIFPQLQTLSGDYRRVGVSLNPPTNVVGANRFFDQWNFDFNLAWEVDFWGRFRRAIAEADALLEASCADYDQVLVTLLGDVASNYVQIRTDQARIQLLVANVDLQQKVLNIVRDRFNVGKVGKLDLVQAESTLEQTKAAIPQLQIDMRQANNRLCILLGIPPVDLLPRIGNPVDPRHPVEIIPRTPQEVIVGIPAELLRRRPDVRRAERLAAAQAEEIGIALADLYPAFAITGNFGYQARSFSHLFTNQAFNGSVGPSFQWNILNYGRIINNARFQDARFQELVVVYQNTVLRANQEVEDGLVTFLKAQERERDLAASVRAAQEAVDIAVEQYQAGSIDFNRYATIEQNLVLQQDLLAQARGQIAAGLIAVYRSLGGGWQIRCPQAATPPPGPPVPLPPTTPTTTPPGPEPVPSPLPETAPAPPPLPGSGQIEPRPPVDPLPGAPMVPAPTPEPFQATSHAPVRPTGPTPTPTEPAKQGRASWFDDIPLVTDVRGPR